MTPRRILAVLDDSEDQIALRTAHALAIRTGAELRAVFVVEPPHDLALVSRLVDRDADRLLDELVGRIEAETKERLDRVLPNVPIEPLGLIGKAFIEIIRFVRDHGCDFVVKAAEPLTGLHRFLFASTDQHLLRKCPCPVWLQTRDAEPSPRRVLATVDLDTWDAAEPETLFELNRRVIEAACVIAAPAASEVVVLHAWDAVGEGMVWAFSGGDDGRLSADRYVKETMTMRRDAMRDLLASAGERVSTGPTLVPRLSRGSPEDVIHAEAEALRADVAVMGTVARTGLSGVFIGNTAENIINNLSCPVLAVKPEGFVTPLA